MRLGTVGTREIALLAAEKERQQAGHDEADHRGGHQELRDRDTALTAVDGGHVREVNITETVTLRSALVDCVTLTGNQNTSTVIRFVVADGLVTVVERRYVG